jgi:hypothetical protein
MLEILRHIAAACRTAKRKRIKLAIRPNGSSDIAYEGLRVMVSEAFAAELSAISGHTVTAGAHTIFSAFPRVQMLDYTKSARRFERTLPSNYHLTFSRSESNESDALRLLASGRNVAVVFAKLPKTWNGYRVINGDLHDLRHLDPRGVVVGLTPKGNKAKRDQSGFVVR